MYFQTKLTGGHFIVETNGIMLGFDSSLIDLLKPLDCRVRLCVKAHNDIDFLRITGAKAEGFPCQLLAAEALRKATISHSIAVMKPFVDPRKLPCHVHEVEELISYKSTVKNLRLRDPSLLDLIAMYWPHPTLKSGRYASARVECLGQRLASKNYLDVKKD